MSDLGPVKDALESLLDMLRAKGVMRYSGPIWNYGSTFEVEFQPPKPPEPPPDATPTMTAKEILAAATEAVEGERCPCGHLETEHGNGTGCLLGCPLEQCAPSKSDDET